MTEEQKGNGIQSVELGLEILKKMAEASKPLTITEISNLCDMSKSKLHRYLTSFCRAGILEKSAELRYTLGTELILLGLRAAERMDIKEIAAPYLSSLRETLNETVALAIWGENGPFFLRWEESNRAINIGIKTGSQVSITSSATGKVFAAFLPNWRTERLIQKELQESAADADAYFDELELIKQNGYSSIEGEVVHGIAAISCPIFGQGKELMATITVVGLIGGLDLSESSDTIRTIKNTCAALSKAIGYLEK